MPYLSTARENGHSDSRLKLFNGLFRWKKSEKEKQKGDLEATCFVLILLIFVLRRSTDIDVYQSDDNFVIFLAHSETIEQERSLHSDIDVCKNEEFVSCVSGSVHT